MRAVWLWFDVCIYVTPALNSAPATPTSTSTHATPSHSQSPRGVTIGGAAGAVAPGPVGIGGP